MTSRAVPIAAIFMGISKDDEQRVIALLLPDVVATLGEGYESIVQGYAAHERVFYAEPELYVERVVGDVQQYFHDCFVDTVWPRCPRHPNHPMWFERAAWHADGEPVAALGELALLVR